MLLRFARPPLPSTGSSSSASGGGSGGGYCHQLNTQELTAGALARAAAAAAAAANAAGADAGADGGGDVAMEDATAAPGADGSSSLDLVKAAAGRRRRSRRGWLRRREAAAEAAAPEGAEPPHHLLRRAAYQCLLRLEVSAAGWRTVPCPAIWWQTNRCAARHSQRCLNCTFETHQFITVARLVPRTARRLRRPR